MTHDTWLLADASLAILGLVILVAWLKFNSFVALAVAAVAAGLGAGLAPLQVADAFQSGVGNLLGSIAPIIGLGAILGQMLAESGGAERIADSIISKCGARWLASAVILVAFLIGIPVFFQVGLVLLIPIVEKLSRQTGIRFCRLGLPLVAGLSVSHGLAPPHPGAMAAVAKLHADVGKTILFALVIGLPTALISGLAFSRINCGELTDTPQALAADPQVSKREPPRPAGALLSLVTILLPVALMIASSISKIWLDEQDPLQKWLAFFGHPMVALLLAVLLSFYTLGWSRGFTSGEILKFSEASLIPVGGVLLVLAGGGGFNGVLIASGVADAVANKSLDLALSPLLLGWLLAAVVRVATGSATVAIVTASALVAPLLAAQPGVSPELMIVAMGAGSLVLSHVNDGGFWLVQKYLRMSVADTLRTWTLMETLISFVALVLTLATAALIGATESHAVDSTPAAAHAKEIQHIRNEQPRNLVVVL